MDPQQAAHWQGQYPVDQQQQQQMAGGMGLHQHPQPYVMPSVGGAGGYAGQQQQDYFRGELPGRQMDYHEADSSNQWNQQHAS